MRIMDAGCCARGIFLSQKDEYNAERRKCAGALIGITGNQKGKARTVREGRWETEKEMEVREGSAGQPKQEKIKAEGRGGSKTKFISLRLVGSSVLNYH